MSAALITADEARGATGQFKRLTSKYIPAITEAIAEEIRKTAHYVAREFEYKKSKNAKTIQDKQRLKILDHLKKIGFNVDTTNPNPNIIRISWKEVIEPPMIEPAKK
jgi:hypothetical protein